MCPKTLYLKIGMLFFVFACSVGWACPYHTPLKLTGVYNEYISLYYGQTETFIGSDRFYCSLNGTITEYQWTLPSQAYCVEGQNTSLLKSKFTPGTYVIELKVKCSHNRWNIEHPNYPSGNRFFYHVTVSNYEGPWHIKPDGNDESHGQDWQNAFKTFDVAVLTAKNGHQIKVAPGVYNQTLDYSGKNIVVTSEDPNGVLKGWDLVNRTILNPLARPAVTFKGTELSTCQLKGFTVTGEYQEGWSSRNELAGGLELYLKLDDGDGTVAIDSSGHSRHGEVQYTPFWSTNGIAGGAFSSTSGHIVIPGYKGVLGSQSRTTTAWIKTTSSGGIVYWGGLNAPNPAHWSMGVQTGLGQKYARFWPGYAFAYGTATIVNDGKWHHLAVVLPEKVNPEVQDIEIYVDGILELCSYSSPHSVISTVSDSDVWVGRDCYYSHVGLIDEVRIYSRALSENEIRLLAGSGGVQGNGTLANISMCVIKNNHSGGSGGGISKVNGEISNCQIINNTALVSGGGLAGCGGVIRNCIITGNRSALGAAIVDSAADIINCTITDNVADAGGAAIGNCTGTIKNCILWGNIPTQYAVSSQPTYSCIQGWAGNKESSPYNFGDDPLFVSTVAGNYRLSLNPLSPCVNVGDPVFVGFGKYDIDMGSRFTFGRVDVGADELDGVNVVGKRLCGSIQYAIDRAADGDTIIVSPGIYYENISFKGKRIKVQSLDPTNPTIVENTIIQGSSNTHVVSFNNSESRDSILSGFTITDDGNMGNGVGIFCNGSSPQIKYCNVKDIKIAGSNKGAILIQNGSPRLENCTIEGCNQDGIRSGASLLEVYQCRIIGNAQWGINHNWYNSRTELVNCLIAGNSRGNYYNGVDTLLISNCTIADNGLFVENNSYGLSAGYVNHLKIDNSIIWNNGQNNAFNMQLPFSPRTYSINYSCLGQSIQGGTGNVVIAPQFVNTQNNDYRLQSTSPCIDAGDPLSSYENEPIPNGSRINMGAYGNTSEAATSESVDANGDGIRDSWQAYYWNGTNGKPLFDPEDTDPTAPWAPDSDFDGSGFTNWIEYLYGYNPTNPEPNSLDVRCLLAGPTLSPIIVDPTLGQSMTITYMTNKISDVSVTIKNAEVPNTHVWSYSVSNQSPGRYSVLWGGRDVNGNLIAPNAYDVFIDAVMGGGLETDSWSSDRTGLYEGYRAATTTRGNIYNPYANIPFMIDLEATDWFRGSIISNLGGGSTDITRGYLFKPGIQRIEWDGRWRIGQGGTQPSGVNELDIYPGTFTVQYVMDPNVPKSGVIVYYEKPIRNVKCHPYLVLPVHNEVVTITYDLTYEGHITVDVYSPNGGYMMTLIDNELQPAGRHTVYWYGRTSQSSDLAVRSPAAGVIWQGDVDDYGRYLTEGDYRIMITSQELNTTVIGAIRVRK
jgi:hypothetical protein